MRDYKALKQEIQQYIRTNNNQEITGEVLQNVLVSIVSNVGENAGFGGIAKKTTSPGTPDGPVFYFATEQGVYPNFGGLEIERENTLNIIYNTEDGWDTLFLGNLVPNEEVEDFRTFKHLENMHFEEASEYCAVFENIVTPVGGGAIQFSKPVIFTFSYLGTEQGMIINLPAAGGIAIQFAFTRGNKNGGLSRRILQIDLASQSVTNVGEWQPISSIIPKATTSADGLMSKEDKIKLGNALTDLLQEDESRGKDGYKFKLKHVKAGGGTGYTQISIPPVDSSSPDGTGVMTSMHKVQLDHSLKELEGYIAGDTLGIRASRNRTDLAKSSAVLPLAKAHNETSDGAPKPGIMSGPDKNVLGYTDACIITNCSDNFIDSFTRTGTYRVFGERTNANDGLPILNSNPGHTVEGILKVLDSSISGSGQSTDKVVTQVLTMSNRTGGDGHIWIRTGQGASDQGLTWSTWEKLQGIFEKNIITTDPLEALDSFTTNGMYSGIFTQPFSINIVDGSYDITTASQFLVITNNGYALASPEIGGQTPVIMQMVFLLYDGRSVSFSRTGTWNGASWVYGKIRISSNISVNRDGVLRTIDNNGVLRSTIGSNAIIKGNSYIGSNSRISDSLKFIYSDGILTITAGDGKKAVITLS